MSMTTVEEVIEAALNDCPTGWVVNSNGHIRDQEGRCPLEAALGFGAPDPVRAIAILNNDKLSRAVFSAADGHRSGHYYSQQTRDLMLEKLVNA